MYGDFLILIVKNAARERKGRTQKMKEAKKSAEHLMTLRTSRRSYPVLVKNVARTTPGH